MLQDFQFALRRFFRMSAVFSAVAGFSLAPGIAANTAIFALVDQLILRRLPVQDPDRLVLLFQDIRDVHQVYIHQVYVHQVYVHQVFHRPDLPLPHLSLCPGLHPKANWWAVSW